VLAVVDVNSCVEVRAMLRVFVLMALSFALSQAALGEKSEKTEVQAANCEKVAKF
jgi:hypothetical protein